MGETKELNIKNRTYYFFDDMIDIRNFLIGETSFRIKNLTLSNIKRKERTRQGK